MYDTCDLCPPGEQEIAEVQTCARCGVVFCLDCGALRYNETGESDWVCYECDDDDAAHQTAMKREYNIALREGGFYACFPEQDKGV